MDRVHPRILCIAGSPRRSGNSEQLLQACAHGIAEAGGVSDLLPVAERDVRPCTGCGTCSVSGSCVIRDDMVSIYSRIDEADAIAVASPVYFATVPAQLKALYDRCQPYWARARLSGAKPLAVADRRPGALLLVRAGGDPFGFDAAVTTTRSVFAVLGVSYAQDILVAGPDEAGDILRYPDALEGARALGERLVRTVAAQRRD
ncbi:MAG: NAD(P)H-dependent oxidoreductase [Coriobacteriia bacterium]|nr:NAD(P)H-dependent oxidoreductase [Coriobacteriia bacterium]